MAVRSLTPPVAIESTAMGFCHGIAGLVPDGGYWPARVVVLDVETRTIDGMAMFQLGYARLYLKDTEQSYQYSDELIATSPEELWSGIDGWTRARDTMRVYSHNSLFDFGVSFALRILTDLGYSGIPGKTIAIGADGEPWMILKRGPHRGTVTLLDSLSALGRVGIPTLAAATGVGKQPPLADDREGMIARCSFDVNVVSVALLEHLYPFLREHHTHPGAVSGAGLGNQIFRTLFYQSKSVIHHGYDPLFELEERAGGGGRREGWRGGLIAERLEEWDYELAHPSICLEPLPVAQVGGWTITPHASGIVYLHRVLVHTPVEVLPYDDPKTGRRIFPVGRFETVVWGDELALALENGAVVLEWRETWAYRTAPFAREWAYWISDQLNGECTDPVILHCLKQWSHTMVGTWGGRRDRWEEVTGERRWPAYEVEHFGGGQAIVEANVHGADHDRELYWPDGDGGGRIFQVTDRATVSEKCAPQVTSYVMMRARVKLWKAMQAAGLENIVAVNTDGLLVTRKGGNRLRRKRPEGLRLKERYPGGVRVTGAAGIFPLEEGTRKVAGLKHSAIEIRPGVFQQTEFQHARAAGIGGEGIRVGTRTLTLPEHPMGRRRLSDGSTAPHRIRMRE